MSEEKMDWQAAVEYHQAKVRYHLKMLRQLHAVDETGDSPDAGPHWRQENLLSRPLLKSKKSRAEPQNSP